MKKNEVIDELLKSELITSMGCTEPSAIAYAVSYSKEQIPNHEKVEKVNLLASSNILKNALCVSLPNTNINGLSTIITLALVKCKSSEKLTILNNITTEDIEKASVLKENINITIALKENVNPLYIEVNVKSKNHSVSVIVEQIHDRIKSCIIDNKTIFNKIIESKEEKHVNLTFDDIYSYINEKKYDKKLMEKVKNYNYEVGKYGLNHSVGMNIGSNIRNLNIYTNKIEKIISTTVAGIDSRMSGVPKKVIINSGSGNQGLTATIPIIEFAKQYNIPSDKETAALALSHLTTIYIRSKQSRLSSSCGAICASAGVAAGIAYMIGCNKNQIEGAIKNLLCSIFGVFCDGAKETCALKVLSSISCAINSAIMASNGIFINNAYGIISPSLEETLISLGKIENKFTKVLDKTIMNETIRNTNR